MNAACCYYNLACDIQHHGDDICVVFFFFQAEDGIRDHCVTGVQTCALPICGLLGILMMIPLRRALIVAQHGQLKYPEGTACAEVLKAGASDESRAAAHREGDVRSEERRVGKECRSRWARYGEKKSRKKSV